MLLCQSLYGDTYGDAWTKGKTTTIFELNASTTEELKAVYQEAVYQAKSPGMDSFKDEVLRKKWEFNQSLTNRVNLVPKASHPELSPNFTAITLSQSGSTPPDSNGCVGTEQYIAFVNGFIRSFNKKTGKADGILNLTPETFFSSVIAQIPGAKTFATDPHAIFDHRTNRWYLLIIDASIDTTSHELLANNQVLLAVSDGKQNGKISNSTKWHFFSFYPGSISPQSDYFFETLPSISGYGYFADYPTFGVDKHALYIGINAFNSVNGAFLTSDMFVLNKKALLKNILKVTPFRNLASSSLSGMFTPQGATNFDEDETDGFIIAADPRKLDQFYLRRVKNPGSDSLFISSEIPITVPLTAQPLSVPARGSLKELDGIDNRLSQSHIRNGKLYTCHGIAVNYKGSSIPTSKAPIDRTGSRWYQFSLKNPEKPKLVQYGTLCDSRKTSKPLSYWIPSIMTNRKQVMLLGCSVAGKNSFANAAVAYRHASDAKGFLHKPKLYTKSTTPYNSLETSSVYRWGDFSILSADPSNNSIWSIQEFCNDTNSWGTRVVRFHP